MGNKYHYLVSVLDQICKEAPAQYKRYDLTALASEGTDNARSRAFIHLFLKVKFGLTDFEEREHLVTDGPGDGGLTHIILIRRIKSYISYSQSLEIQSIISLRKRLCLMNC